MLLKYPFTDEKLSSRACVIESQVEELPLLGVAFLIYLIQPPRTRVSNFWRDHEKEKKKMF